MKRIFITGISGFIGFHLALALKQRGDAVFGCDNFNSYYTPALKHARAALLKQSGIDLFLFDVNEKQQLLNAIEKHQITHFVHLAAQAGVRHCLTHPETYVHSNLNGFVQVMEALAKHPHIPLTYASSSSVYGLKTKVPFAESDPTESVASFYAATKKSNELIAASYHHIYKIPVTGLRFFTVYGPWGRPDMAYFLFSKAIAEGKPIQVFAQGLFQRDFTYIDDIIEGTIAAIDLQAKSEIFNLGNNRPHTVLELIAILEQQQGKKAVVNFVDTPLGDVPITYADIGKSERMLNYRPTTSLSAGLEKFPHWFSSQGSQF